MRIIPFDQEFISLKHESVNKSAIVFDEDFLIVRKYQDQIKKEPFVHVMFDDSYGFDGVQIALGLNKNQTTLVEADDCEYKVYLISNSTPWQETLVKSGTLTQNANRLYLTTMSNAEAAVDMLGDHTFKIWARIFNSNTPYYIQKYFNHLGISDSVLRVTKKVNFLQITKKDFGV